MKKIEKHEYVINVCRDIIIDEVDNSYIIGEEFDKALSVLKDIDGDWRVQQYFDRADDIRRQYDEGMIDSDTCRQKIMSLVDKGVSRLFRVLEERYTYCDPEYYTNKKEALADVKELLAEAV